VVLQQLDEVAVRVLDERHRHRPAVEVFVEVTTPQ
jgi:hypothetical protein